LYGWTRGHHERSTGQYRHRSPAGTRGLPAGGSDPAFRACVARQAQYVFDTFGKFPGTVPSVFIMNYVQAHHLDLDFYDRFFKPGAYLRTHAEHMQRWHGERQEG
jgi:hypothetical protein